ncbi:MAG: universal stress protein, partial [Blastomonas sp.]|nr:universal stress protein [Blastomonas sp.]
QSGLQVSPYFMSAQGVEEISFIRTGAANCADGGEGWNRRRCLAFNALLNHGHSPLRNMLVGSTTTQMIRSGQMSVLLFR